MQRPQKPHGMPRRSVLIGASFALLSPIAAAHAQSSAPITAENLERLIDRTLKGSNEQRFGAGGTVGLPDRGANAKYASFEENGVTFTFAVIVPRQADGLLLLSRHLATNVGKVHRTDTHLRRVASARIQGGIVSEWDGAECDADFAAQLAAWAKRIPPASK